MRALLCVCLAAAGAAAMPGGGDAPAAAPDLTIFYDGGADGFSCSIPELKLLLAPSTVPDLEVAMRETAFGVLRAGRWYVVARPDLGHAVSAADVLAAPDRTVEVLDAGAPALVGAQGVLLQWPRADLPDLVERVAQTARTAPSFNWRLGGDVVPTRLLRLRAGGREAFAIGLPAQGTDATDEPPRRVEEFAITAGVRAVVRFGEREGDVFALCREYGGAGRRYPELRRRLAATPPGRRVLLGAGDQLPSVPSGPYQVDLIADKLALLAALGFDALAPAAGELQRGIDWLVAAAARHRLPYLAANLTWRDGERAGKPVFPRYRLLRRGEVTVAVVGLVPEEVRGEVYGARLGNVVIGDVGEALESALEAATAELGRRPDVTVALLRLDPRRTPRMRQPPGVDVLIGRAREAFSGVAESSAVPDGRRPAARPLLLEASPAWGSFGEIDLTLGRDGVGPFVARVDHRSPALGDSFAHDPALRARGTTAVLRLARSGGDRLLPPPGDVVRGDPELGERAGESGVGSALWHGPLWHALAAHLARDALRAEVGAVRPFSPHVNSGGALSAYVVDEALADAGALAVVSLSGRELLALAQIATGDRALVFAAFDPAARTVDGRPLDEAQSYRVALSEELLTDPAFEPVLRGKTPSPGGPLPALAVAELRALRDGAGGMTPGYAERIRARLRPAGDGPRPLWTLGAEDVRVVYLVNRAEDTGRFRNVREQRVQNPDYQLVTARGALAATYDSATITWRTATGFRFNRLFFGALDEQVPQAQREFEDVIAPETELRLKTLRLTTRDAAWQVVPFARAAYETELTPVELGTRAAGDLERLPRRSYLSGTGGVGLFPGRLLQEARLGVVLQNDFAKPAGKTLQLGPTAAVKLRRPVGPLEARLDGNLTYFPDRGETEPADLDVIGLQAQGVLSLTVPLGAWLRVGVAADYLAFRGKVPATDAVGQSLQVGATLELDRRWKPQYQPLF